MAEAQPQGCLGVLEEAKEYYNGTLSFGAPLLSYSLSVS